MDDVRGTLSLLQKVVSVTAPRTDSPSHSSIYTPNKFLKMVASRINKPFDVHPIDALCHPGNESISTPGDESTHELESSRSISRGAGKRPQKQPTIGCQYINRSLHEELTDPSREYR